MHIRNCLDCVQTIEFETTTSKSFCKGAIAREIIILDLDLCWWVLAIVHVVGTIDGRANIKTISRVSITLFFGMECSLLLVSNVVTIWVNAFLLKFLFDHFTLDQPLCFPKIVHGIHNFTVCWS